MKESNSGHSVRYWQPRH